jgi:hypothetical protein
MLLGIPITHYILNIAQVPIPQRRRRRAKPNPAEPAPADDAR